MDDRVLALCELSNDLLFRKIPEDRLAYYVDSSLEAGRSTAALFRGQDIRELYRQNHIEIRYAGSGKQNYGVILRGQSAMSKAGCRVEVYRDSIAALASHSTWEGQSLTTEQALDIHLAHEFFHIWEFQQGRSIADALEPVTRFQFLDLKKTAHVRRCEEIAAHAFAKAFLDLPYLPNFYDYCYLITTGKMTQEAFQALTDKMTALLP